MRLSLKRYNDRTGDGRTLVTCIRLGAGFRQKKQENKTTKKEALK